jgi:hypothetical protein
MDTGALLYCELMKIGVRKAILYIFLSPLRSGFGGLVVSMLASGTRVRGFIPGRSCWIFSGVKILSMPSFGSKAVGPMSQICGTLKNLCDYMEVGSKAKFVGHFSLFSFTNRAARGPTEGSTLVQHGRPWS